MSTQVRRSEREAERAGYDVTKLYQSRVQVYPARVRGRIRTLKWVALVAMLAIYYGLPWVRWPRGAGLPDQAVLLDIAGRRAYLFDLVIWPQQIWMLTGALIVGALGLFFVTALFGRLWCGFACPQTVWTDLFMLVERWIEGDAQQRRKLDAAPWSTGKIARRTVKHTAWLLIAFATGGAWIAYYVDAPTLARQFFVGEASVAAYVFVFLFTATTYLLAGWAREQVCTYMCPWPRFQSAMFDDQTLTVSYRAWRGEPRGKARDGSAGDCVDCLRCVAVCPTGIDIRDGLQLECIGCGLCVDACNDIMAKLDRPRGLIAWDTVRNLAARGQAGRARLLRPRSLLYVGLLAVIGTLLLASMVLRDRVDLAVERERAPDYVLLSDGTVRDAYTLRIENRTQRAAAFALAVEGLDGAQMRLADAALSPQRIPVAGNEIVTLRVFVAAPRSVTGTTRIAFALRGIDGAPDARHATVFVGEVRR